jgi:tetratricopeptide (TPR) repeat protein
VEYAQSRHDIHVRGDSGCGTDAGYNRATPGGARSEKTTYEWASQAFGESLVPERHLKNAADAREALARHLYWSGDFANSLAHALQWIEEEPFSNLAYRSATAAASILENYQKVEALSDRGLMHSPNSIELITSKVFALACQDKLDEAEQTLATLASKDESDAFKFILEADRGLIALRRGHWDTGEAHYRSAILGFRKQGNLALERLAKAFFAREAVRFGHSNAAYLIREAEEANRREPVLANADFVMAQARALLQRIGLSSSPPSPMIVS